MIDANMLPIAIPVKDLRKSIYSMQEQIWRVILDEMRLKETDIMDDEAIIHAATAARVEVKRYVHCLIKNGYAELIKEEHIGNRRKNRTFRIVEKQLEAPRFNGKSLPIEPHENEDRLWRTIRMLKEFTAKKLSMAADVNIDITEKYCKALSSVMILLKRNKTYYLRNDIGGKAPLIKPLRTVFNPNEEKLLIPADRNKRKNK